MIDSRQVRASGEGLEKIAINRPALFFIDVQGQTSTLDVRVLSPARKLVPSCIEIISEHRYSVEYTPTEVGKMQTIQKESSLISFIAILIDY